MNKFLILSLSIFFALNASARIDAETIFNTPGFAGRSTPTVENKLISLIEQAKIGSTIRAALYTVDRSPITHALVLAAERGVDVQLVLDGGNLRNASVEGHAVNALIAGFDNHPGIRCSEEECVHFCHGPIQGLIHTLKIKKSYDLGGSCRGLVINHNKLFLFSELNDGTRNVVAQTSANMMEHQLEMYNDLILIKNDPAFFDSFMDYWYKLRGDHTVLFKKSFPTISSDESHLKAYFFPRLVSSDPVYQLLKRVDCHLPGSIIRASQAAFTRSKVAREMKRLADEGCQVQVIARVDRTQHSPAPDVRQMLGTNMLVIPYRGTTPEQQSVNSIHTKIVLINASIDHSAEKVPVVLTGSHNLDLFSLRTNDETLLEIRDQDVFNSYMGFLDRLVNDFRASGLPSF